MKKTIPFLIFCFFAGSMAYAENAKITAFDGDVEAKLSREGQWVKVSDKMEIPEGGSVRTLDSGSAALLMPNKSKVWMKNSTALEIEQRQTLASRLALFFGKVKIRVPHLMRKEKFEVRTPAAVCAVRGTEFTIDAAEDGKMDLQVFYGEVKMDYAVPPSRGKSKLEIPQGHVLKIEQKGVQGKLALLNNAQETSGLENWDPGLQPKERLEALEKRRQEREEIREFARVSEQTEKTVKNFLQTVKEADIEAGRTLTDVHGNLVRVDQRLIRPNGKTLQFFNLVKRSAYNYTDKSFNNGGFKNNSEKGKSRLDLFQMNMIFNVDIPQRIEEWPGFFSDDNVVRADKASFIMANKTNAENIFMIATLYEYDKGQGELVNDARVLNVAGQDLTEIILMGDLINSGGTTAAEKLNEIAQVRDVTGNDSGQLNFKGTGYLPVTEVAWVSQAPGAPILNGTNFYKKTFNPSFYQYQADVYRIGKLSGSGDYVWFAREDYVIGNSGQIKQVGDFVNSSQDPFSLLKETAIERVMYVKKNIGGTDWTPACVYKDHIDNSATGDYFASAKNIDLVFIPDLAVAAIQRILPAVQELNK